MLPSLLIGFSFGFVSSMPVAGPIAILVFARGAARRYRSGAAIAAGASVAEGGYAFLAYWGFSAILARYDFVVPIGRALAAVMLIGLGIILLRRRFRPSTEDPPPERGGRCFLLGFTIAALNPALLGTWSVAVAALHSTKLVAFTPELAPAFAVAAGAGIACWFAVLLTLLRRYAHRLREGLLERVVHVMGVFLLGVGTWFVVQLAQFLATAQA